MRLVTILLNSTENSTTNTEMSIGQHCLRENNQSLNDYFGGKMSEINYLNLSFKKLEKVQQRKPKVSRKKEIIEWKSMK